MTSKNHTKGPSARFHRLRDLQVIGGFLDGARFSFTEGLNCLIGPRGSGKSTAVELIRFAFDQGPTSADGSAAQRRFQSLIEANLSGGQVQLDIETADGMRYRVTRKVDEDPIIQDSNGEPLDLQFKTGALFHPDVFSQNDVEMIADHPSIQLELIDGFKRDELREANARIRKGIQILAENADQIRKLEDSIETITVELRELPNLKETLKGMANVPGAKAEEINQAHAARTQREKESAATEAGEVLLQKFVADLKLRLEILQRDAEAVYPVAKPETPNASLVTAHRQRFEGTCARATALISDAAKQLTAEVQALEAIRADLLKAHQKQEIAFQEFIKKVNASNEQTRERLRLEKKKVALEARKREQEGFRKRLEKLWSDRQQYLDRLSELSDERYQLRQAVADDINAQLAPNIRVSVRQNDDRTALQELLTDLLASARTQPRLAAQRIAETLSPQKLLEFIEAGDSRAFSEWAGLGETMGQKVFAALQSREARLRIEAVILDELTTIELLDGGEYKDSRDLSTGQKCTAILPILMLDSARPLIIDQPEDNLDNSFVYDGIVQSVQKVKNRRQLLFITHNPNIPVLGEAERIFVLRSSGKNAAIEKAGTVDDCRDQIVRLLEGGEKAFMLRKERYKY